VLMLLTGTVK